MTLFEITICQPFQINNKSDFTQWRSKMPDLSLVYKIHIRWWGVKRGTIFNEILFFLGSKVNIQSFRNFVKILLGGKAARWKYLGGYEKKILW